MPRDIVKTEIQDKWGVNHVYETVPYPFDKGINLKLRILKVIIKPLADVFSEVFTTNAADAREALEAASAGNPPATDETATDGAPEAASVEDPGDAYDVKALDVMDWSGLGELVDQIPQRLIDAGGAKLIAEILAETRRITPGATPEEKATRLVLSKPLARDHAYAGGNWPECLKACAWVLGVNYSPFSTDGSQGWGTMLSGLSDLLPIVRGEG